MKQKITMKTSKNLTVGEAVELFFRKAAVKNLSNVNSGMQEEIWYTVIAEFQEKLKKSRGRSKTFYGYIRRW